MAATDTSAAVLSRAAVSVVMWGADRLATAIVRRAEKRVVHAVKTRAVRIVGAVAVRPAPPPAAVPEGSVRKFLRRPFMGTDLTTGRAIATFTAAPAFWLAYGVALAALPA